ncbi:MAG: glycerate kinase [Bacillaceae bacterium]|nr:glycerate kinase [Bacillaceae bacterium]
MLKKKKVPTIIFAGSVEDNLFDLKEENIVAIIPIVDQPMTLNEAMQNGQTLLTRAVQRTFHLINLQM